MMHRLRNVLIFDDLVVSLLQRCVPASAIGAHSWSFLAPFSSFVSTKPSDVPKEPPPTQPSPKVHAVHGRLLSQEFMELHERTSPSSRQRQGSESLESMPLSESRQRTEGMPPVGPTVHGLVASAKRDGRSSGSRGPVRDKESQISQKGKRSLKMRQDHAAGPAAWCPVGLPSSLSRPANQSGDDDGVKARKSNSDGNSILESSSPRSSTRYTGTPLETPSALSGRASDRSSGRKSDVPPRGGNERAEKTMPGGRAPYEASPGQIEKKRSLLSRKATTPSPTPVLPIAPPPKAPWDRVWWEVRQADSVEAIRAALAPTGLGRPTHVSARAAAEALSSLARLESRRPRHSRDDMGSRSVPDSALWATPAALSSGAGGGRIGDPAPGPTRSNDEVSSFSLGNKILIPRLEQLGLHTLNPQALVPLFWSLPRLGLRPRLSFLEELMRELLANDMEAVRCRGESGLLMLAQGLAEMQGQEVLSLSCRQGGGPRGQDHPNLLLALGESGAERTAHSFDQQDGSERESVADKCDIDGARKGSSSFPYPDDNVMGSLPLEEHSSSEDQPFGSSNPVVDDIGKPFPSSAPPPLVGPDQQAESAKTCGELFTRLVSGVASAARALGGASGRPLEAVRPQVLSGLASNLARLGLDDELFFEQVADQALARVDTLPTVSLSLILRALAAVRVYSPELLTAAEPHLADGIAMMPARGIPELLHSYAIFSHPCPILLPLASRLAAEAAATGSLSPSRMAWVDRCAAKLERHGRTAVQPS